MNVRDSNCSPLLGVHVAPGPVVLVRVPVWKRVWGLFEAVLNT